jgi:hypothetical protein
VKGFGLAGDVSFFPHMHDQWQSLVEEKTAERSDEEKVYCLTDEDACCVEGKRKRRTVLTLIL